MKKSLIVIPLLLVLTNTLKSQAYHFSQFYSTPLLTNPANTGFMDGPYRLASNFRKQGMLGESAYFTGYLSADFSLLRNKLPEGNKVGLGMYVMNDQSLNRALQTNSVGFSAAYTVVLDEYGYYSLGVGLQGTYHERKLDYSRLNVENQFGPDGSYNPNPDLVDGSHNYRKQKYIDANAGIMYHANLENQSFFAGFSIYNSVKHKEYFLEDEFKMPIRYMLQTGGRVDVSATGSVYFSIMYMRQSKANETTAGVAYGVLLSEDASKEIDFGFWYRYKDALIPYVGYKINGFQLGFTYDHTVSALKTASQIRNGYELTLLFNAPDLRELKRLIPWY